LQNRAGLRDDDYNTLQDQIATFMLQDPVAVQSAFRGRWYANGVAAMEVADKRPSGEADLDQLLRADIECLERFIDEIRQSLPTL
jgi:hypothetical protein